MFESAELGHHVEDTDYKRQEAKLRADLLDAQYDLLADASFPVIVLVNGVDGAGKGETVNLFNAWMDPRNIRSHAFGEPTDEERQRPPMWRFWRALPPKGRIGILFGNWYTQPIVGRVSGELRDADLTAAVDRVRHFERMLADEGALIVKYWFHLSKKAQKKRLKDLESHKLTRWRVTKEDWKNFERYDDFRQVSERVLRDTSTGESPWVVIDGSDANYRSLAAGKTLLTALRDRLDVAKRQKADGKKNGAHVHGSALFKSLDTARILRDLPFEERLSKPKYETKIEKASAELAGLARSSKMRKHGVVIVFEGMDAAGKGGTIRRITAALDARSYNVIPIAAPSEEERAQPYLWRFWRHLPPRGRFTIFDRSWYGRVLVERVEGFATPDAWLRAYGEINEFEEQLTESGYVVVKLWLAISKEEQLRRFKEREHTRFKRFKITQDDWRNRKKWDDYLQAASDMIDRTSTSTAPWTVLESNDKHLARVRAIETVCRRIKEAF
ncbi:MAG TPA: polyphosphate:AMP phosphotransferase [Labilithrix sp.]|jgi:polyphosphate:AMP phosphotransferase